MRVADIDMTRLYTNCPPGFRKLRSSGKVMCGGRDLNSPCLSTNFSTHGIKYSRVCGRIVGYQFGRTSSFVQYVITNRGVTLDGAYLDRIALTHGSPRTHIWSFAAGINQYHTRDRGCPCTVGYIADIPRFIYRDFFCDSGHTNSTPTLSIFYLNHPLWDGEGCVNGNCCQFNSPPWFCRDLLQPTTDDIELRLCGFGWLKGTPFEVVELYVQ